MRNKHPGICYRCKKEVAPYEGHFQILPKELRKFSSSKWVVQHAKCAIEHRIFKSEKIYREK